MKYQNPIIPGFYPDPSICRVGDDFYVVNSTFEFFPAVVISHSKDLIHWEQIGHCITRNSQLTLPEGGMNNLGIFAPTLRYKDGRFYMVVTNVAGEGNFFVWTDDIRGEWSDPIILNTPGIDPSFFFDDDGKTYYMGTGSPEIYITEIDLETGKIGEIHKLWAGTGGAYPEGPHIYKKDGWYYLMISEGGTERGHMLTMARSKNLFGPYEECPNNPVMTNRSWLSNLESVGHADLTTDTNGNWWAVCLGTRTFSYQPKHNLGRETMLVPVDWSSDWPVFGKEGHVLLEFETDKLPKTDNSKPSIDEYFDNFSKEKLDLGWNYLYNPDYSLFEIKDNSLILKGNDKTLSSNTKMAWLARRQRHHDCSVEVTLNFPCIEEGEEAGLSIFLNYKHHYELALAFADGKRKLIFRRQIGTLFKVEWEEEYLDDTVTLKLDANIEDYSFSYKKPAEDFTFAGKGEVRYLTTEVGGHFTGIYTALYSTGTGKVSKTPAVFTNYAYKAI